jgi:hypothetical protein
MPDPERLTKPGGQDPRSNGRSMSPPPGNGGSGQGCSGLFCLPDAKPEAGESAERILIPELGEELGVVPADVTLLGQGEEVAAIEDAPTPMTVLTARIDQDPRPAAKLVGLGLD